ncbi:MAG: Tat proofreading chaperone DmsD [Coriobacteriales bacterium]|nr:Tat proofreading chaperone DmsD [Coriobacteriales bacterium]
MNEQEKETAIRENAAFCAAFLGTLLYRNPASEEAGILMAEIGHVEPFEAWPFGQADIIRRAFDAMTGWLADHGRPNLTDCGQPSLVEDYQELFVGPFKLKAPPWGSVYLDYESVLFGCSTRELRIWMRDNSLSLALNQNEPEDHVGLLLLLFSRVIIERPELVDTLLKQHLCPWVHRFLEIMAQEASTEFYEGLALLTDETIVGFEKAFDISVSTRRLYR